MLDLHCHILPYLDDGAKDWDASLAMCAIAKRDGIHTIVATPHMKPGLFSPSKPRILSHVQELNQRIISSNSSNSKNSTNSMNSMNSRNSRNSTNSVLPAILPGADIAFQPDIIEQIEKDAVLFLNQSPNSTNSINSRNSINSKNSKNSINTFRYLLLELPDYFLFPQVKDLIALLKNKGIIAILSHPERNAMIQRNSKLLRKLIEAGALSQVTAMSVTGEFGKDIQQIARKLLKKNLVHIIASDAHSPDVRPPVLSRAVTQAAKIIGSDRAEKMVQDVPQAVVEGRDVETS